MLASPVVTTSYMPMRDLAEAANRPAAARAADEAQPTADSRHASSREADPRAERPTPADAPTKPNGEPLSESELLEVKQLERIDQETRAHEKAHHITGGAYASAPSYEYQRGPDGERYAVGGEVSIDYGEVKGDPQATIEKMQQVIAAALAPAEPSTKDHQVAAQARQKLLTAQLELAQQRGEMEQARRDEPSPQSGSAPGEQQAIA